MLSQIEYTVLGSPLDQSLRTEAVQFSPSGRNLAVVDSHGQILYFDVDQTARPIRISLRAVYSSEALKRPHGVAFLSDEVIAVANRLGLVEFFRLPDQNVEFQRCSIESIYTLDAQWFGAPGQTRLEGDRPVATGPGAVEFWDGNLYVASNLKNAVCVHACNLVGNTVVVSHSRVISKNVLGIPDAIAVSTDGLWVAISDHCNKQIVVQDAATGKLIRKLENPELTHPHGLRFDNSGKNIVVSDAGGQKLHGFRTADKWSSDSPVTYFNLQGIGQEDYEKTLSLVPEQYRHLEGGIKGVGYDPHSEIFVTTCRHQTLRFFSFN